MDQDSYWVYVLELSDGRRYIGHTNNLVRCLEEHRSGRSPYTRRYKIKGLIYYEKYHSRSAVMTREKFLKTGKGQEWLKQKLAEQAEVQTKIIAELVNEQGFTKQYLDERLKELEYRLIIPLGAMMVVAIGVISTLVKIL